MEKEIETIKETLKLIGELKTQFGIKRNADCDDPLMYAGVANSDVIANITPLVEKYFGKAYKPAGETAYLKNFFDGFVKNVGGARSDQTLFRKDISPVLTMYCAFWPWGSNPVNTSIRIGLLCETEEQEDEVVKLLKGCFK